MTALEQIERLIEKCKLSGPALRTVATLDTLQSIRDSLIKEQGWWERAKEQIESSYPVCEQPCGHAWARMVLEVIEEEINRESQKPADSVASPSEQEVVPSETCEAFCEAVMNSTAALFEKPKDWKPGEELASFIVDNGPRRLVIEAYPERTVVKHVGGDSLDNLIFGNDQEEMNIGAPLLWLFGIEQLAHIGGDAPICEDQKESLLKTILSTPPSSNEPHSAKGAERLGT